MRRVASLSVLVAAVAIGTWLALDGGARSARDRAASAADSRASHPDDLKRSTATSEPSPAAVSATPARREAVPATSGDESATNLWLDGRVLFPSDTPVDEKATAVLRQDAEDPEWRRADVAGDGRFRMSLEPWMRHGELELEARYLYLEEPYSRHTDEMTPVLQPRVGACIEGRVVLPIGTSVDMDGKVVAYRDEALIPHPHVRDVSADPSFALGGLDPRSGYALLRYDGTTLFGRTLVIPVEAGRTARVELVLHAGVALAGRVCDADGKGLPSVHIVAMEADRDVLDIDAADDGAFRFAAPPGDIGLYATKRNFAPLELELGRLAAGERREELELMLTHGAAIEGRVQWPDGTPASASVTVTDEHGRGEWANSETTNGAFRIEGLGASTFEVEVWNLPEEDRARAASSAHRDGHALCRHVVPGTFELVFTLQGPFDVSGRVVDGSSTGLNRFEIRAEPVYGRRYERWTVDARGLHVGFAAEKPRRGGEFRDPRGVFVLKQVWAGTWAFTASAEGYATSHALVDLPNTAPIVLVLEQASVVHGRVLDPRGAPVAGGHVTLDGAKLDEQLRDELADLRTDESGEFDAPGLPPGTIVLHARANGFAPSAPLVLELAADAKPPDVTLSLRESGAITGMVVGNNGRVEADQDVVATNLDDPSCSTTARTDSSGRFALEDLAPGDYRVSASTNSGIELHAEVTLGLGEHARVQLAP